MEVFPRDRPLDASGSEPSPELDELSCLFVQLDHGGPQIFGDEKPKRCLSCQHQHPKKMKVFSFGFQVTLGILDVDFCLVVFTQHFKMVGFHFYRGYLTSLKKLNFGCGFGCGCFYPLNTIFEEYLEWFLEDSGFRGLFFNLSWVEVHSHTQVYGWMLQ